MQDTRDTLASLAYRMLGSVRNAEDVCQDADMQLRRVSRGGTDPGLREVWIQTTRLAIEHLKLAQLRRAEYIGECLPDPLVNERRRWVHASSSAPDTISISFLRALEALEPLERAVFLLHDVFDHPLSHIGPIVKEETARCRGIVTQARAQLDEDRVSFQKPDTSRRAIAGQFLDGIARLDRQAVIGVLSRDASGYVDGGGKVPAWPCRIAGRDDVARVFLGVGAVLRRADLALQVVSVNGQPGALLADAAGRLIDVIALDVVDGAVRTVYSIVNPDKLAHLGEVGDASTLFRLPLTH